MIRTIEWKNGRVRMIDQRLLPNEEIYREYKMQSVKSNPDQNFAQIRDRMSKTRPTAVNLFWAIERMKRVYAELKGLPGRNSRAADLEAQKILVEDIEANRKMGNFENELIPEKASILIHCNAGALATGCYGTALGVIRSAVEHGKKTHAFPRILSIHCLESFADFTTIRV